MSTKIYYFSGTGNSLSIAKELQNDLTDKVTVMPISIFRDEETVQIDTDVLGFVFPVYFMDTPYIVKSFIKKLVFKSKPYIFAVASCNGVPGISLIKFNKYLLTKGQVLSGGFFIDMPGNALPTPEETAFERLKNYKAQVNDISDIINNRTIKGIGDKYKIKARVLSYLLNSFGRKLYLTPENVSVTSDCVGCGICEKVCPLKNIEIVDNKPRWGNNCSTCLACFHWCPKKAIKGGRMLNKRNQYHHPEVSIKDMDLKSK